MSANIGRSSRSGPSICAKKASIPANQLSTDDFAGHLAHNANLSIKAIEAPGRLRADGPGLWANPMSPHEYSQLAAGMAAKWQTMAIDGDHYKLAFDKPGTWSQKYNLVWDKILGFNLFPAKVRQTEIAFYLQHLNQYGLPLDNRADYTKLDWEIWTATLADRRAGTPILCRASWRPSAAGSTKAPAAFRSPTGMTPTPASRLAFRRAAWWEAFTSKSSPIPIWLKNGKKVE